MKRKLLSLILILSLLLASSCSRKSITNSECLTVYFFDVGQADSSLLIFPDSTTMLIDAGNRADGENIAEFLKHGGIDTIDYFICTHPHEDHIPVAENIIYTQDITKTYRPNTDEAVYTPATIYTTILESIEKEKCETLYLTSGTILLKKESYSVKATAPGDNSVYSDLNDYSLSLLIDYYTNTLLFTGDAEKTSESEMINTNINLDADILKVGHHGSRDSSTDIFLKAVTPQVAIISCGKDNTYGHPHTEAISRLNDIGATVYRTDTVGTVIARLYDGGFNIETDNTIELDGNK